MKGSSPLVTSAGADEEQPEELAEESA